MASVRLKPGSSRYFACYKLPTGANDAKGRPIFRRVQRSTGTTDKSRAEQLAVSYERVAILAGEKRFSLNAAHKFLAEIKAVTDAGAGVVEATDVFLRRWVESQKRGVKAKTWKNYDDIVRDFLAFLGPRAAAPVVDVTPRVMMDFRDAEQAKGKGGTTVNKALSVLGQAFEDAVIGQGMDKNPARGVRVKGADKKKQRRRPFTFDQFAALVARTAPRTRSRRGNTVHRDWQLFIVASGYTGGRQQEVAQLDWQRVDFDRRRVGLVRSKSGDVHWIPMHAALETHLRARWRSEAQPAAGLVFPHIAAWEGRKVSRFFREVILPRVGISQPYAKPTEEKGVGRVLAAYSIHSLRHALQTWLAAAGVEESMRMQLIGHEDEDVNRGYTHTEFQQAAAELAKVPNVTPASAASA